MSLRKTPQHNRRTNLENMLKRILIDNEIKILLRGNLPSPVSDRNFNYIPLFTLPSSIGDVCREEVELKEDGFWRYTFERESAYCPRNRGDIYCDRDNAIEDYHSFPRGWKLIKEVKIDPMDFLSKFGYIGPEKFSNIIENAKNKRKRQICSWEKFNIPPYSFFSEKISILMNKFLDAKIF